MNRGGRRGERSRGTEWDVINNNSSHGRRVTVFNRTLSFPFDQQNKHMVSGSEIVVGPNDNLHEAIKDAGTTPILLRAGIYRGGFKLQDGTQLHAYPGEQPVFMGALPVAPAAWEKNGNAYGLKWEKPFYQHPAKQVGLGNAGLQHRAAMQPHMVIVDGQPLQTVYTTAELMPGTMYLEGTADNPTKIWVRFMDDRPPAEFDVHVAHYQQILSTNNKAASGIVLDGLHFRFCANTGYQGMVSLPEEADGWELRNLDLQWSNTEGLHVMGHNHKINNVVLNNHGQNGLSSREMHRCLIENLETSFNNWKGFDPKWDAGNKLRNSTENTLRHIKAVGNPIWWDIENQGNWMEDFEILDAICWGLMVEYHSSNNSFVNGLIRGTRRYNEEEQTGMGLRIQGNIKGCEFSNIRLEQNEGDAVFYKKTEERHGEKNYSGQNTFDNVTYDGKWVVEGDVDKMPDRFRNMAQPAFER